MENSARTPFQNLLNVLPNFPLPQSHNKPLRYAFYNSIALLLLCIGCTTLWAVFRILDPFLKPLIWALLIGSVLHPFKYHLSQQIRNWFNRLQRQQKSLIVSFFMLPFNTINNVSDFVGDKFMNYKQIILWISISLISITTCIIAYLITITNSDYKYGSYVFWLLSSLFISNLFPIAKVPILITLQLLYFIGFIIQLNELQKAINQSDNQNIGLIDSIKYLKLSCSEFETELKSLKNIVESDNDSDTNLEKKSFIENAKTDSKEHLSLSVRSNDSIKSVSSNAITNSKRYSLTSLFQLTANSVAVRNYLKMCNNLQLNEQNKLVDDSLSSDFYLYAVFWMFSITLVWNNILLLTFVPILIILYIFKRTGHYFGCWTLLRQQFEATKSFAVQLLFNKRDALVSWPLIGLRKIFTTFSDRIILCLIDSIDMISTTIVITCLVMFFVIALVFMSLQIYSEGITLLRISSNVINKSVIHNPNMNQFLPPNLDETFDSIFDNAYVYGREGITKFVQNMLNGTEKHKLDKIESQLLDLWDRIYQTWMSASTDHIIGPKVDSTAIFQSWNAFFSDLRKSPEIFNITALIEFLKQNLGTLVSFVQSILVLLKGNLELILSSFTAFLSILFGGSSVVLNFFINLVVFITTLFYLLSSSNHLYKPVDFITKLSPYYGNRFGVALEEAVNDVFSATFKMTLFYGLWTWVIHNLFSVKIVFIPSVLAAILGAVPFLGTYWACIPAVLDLWLAQNCSLKALFFALCQIAPTYVVDTTIYKEIKGGGHPYLTGLAIAGGIFCLGAEGAIFGPLLLCALYVALNFSSDLIREPSNS